MKEDKSVELDAFVKDLSAKGIAMESIDEYLEEIVVDDYDSWKAPFDMWPYNIIRYMSGLEVEKPAYIVRIESENDIVEVLASARENGVCIIPVCGLSNVVGATLPSGKCVFLDVSRMNRILEFDPENRYVVVEAGVKIRELLEWLEAKGYTLTYRPQSEKLACVGGSIGTLGSGALSPRLGNIEDIVLWMEVVTPAGEVLTIGSKRNPRGIIQPGINMVYFGSEGGYGVITKVALRVVEKPETVIDIAFAMESFERAVEAARRIYSWEPPLLMRIQDKREAQLHYGLEKDVVIVQVGGPSRIAGAKAAWIRDLITQLGGTPREGLIEEWWKTRYNYSESMKMVLSAGLAFDTIDMAAYWRVLPRLHKRLIGELESMSGVSLAFSHASHFYINGGALYTTIVFERDPDLYWKIWEKAISVAINVGASIVHHHNIGVLREKWAFEEFEGSLKLAYLLKKALDPGATIRSGILGRVRFDE
ncbi:MAG: FAD-binding oxidoreductase [Desulfurococcales archaeon]|nr:FAD-binding oxidoreductase [Desulfurococcales archaeon]MCE4628725.1 FAD-binding oxidoreductase [Desulfurococcales archaeon]